MTIHLHGFLIVRHLYTLDHYHYPDDLGTSLEAAKQQLKQAGCKTIVTFSKRRRYHLPI